MSYVPLGSAVSIVAVFSVMSSIYGISHVYMRKSDNCLTSPYGDPLYLTPFVKSGEIDKARQLSLVQDLPDTPEIASYSGFFTVNETYNSNIFFWFVPALDGNQSAPLILWLQGGPGLTGLFGFFVEHGPYVIYSNVTADLREYAWTNRFHVIYVDNPVGTGFSFTDDANGYVRNQDQMAENMYEFLRQFFRLFYEYKNNDFYIIGESYGAQFVKKASAMGQCCRKEECAIVKVPEFTDTESDVYTCLPTELVENKRFQIVVLDVNVKKRDSKDNSLEEAKVAL